MTSAGFRAVADDLFTIESGKARLVGTHCRSCDALYFPQTPSCRNPACEDKQVERTLLAAGGSLYSWTVQCYRPPLPFRMDDWAPYPIGLVEIEDRLRVLAMLDIPPESITIGMKLRLDVRPLGKDEDGHASLTYCFVRDDAMEDAA